MEVFGLFVPLVGVIRLAYPTSISASGSTTHSGQDKVGTGVLGELGAASAGVR